MPSNAALSMAIALYRRPALCRAARRTAVPAGTISLLKIICGDPEALAEARTLTGIGDARLQEIAAFYAEQVLLSQGTDSYRVLGCRHDADASELRSHMVLLMKWLHPDHVRSDRPPDAFDRSAFSVRVARAWQDLKTDDRRRQYDATLAIAKKGRKLQRPHQTQSKKQQDPRRLQITRSEHSGVRKRRRQAASSTMFSRLLSLLRGER